LKKTQRGEWQGLYIDMPAWGYNVFAVAPAG